MLSTELRLFPGDRGGDGSRSSGTDAASVRGGISNNMRRDIPFGEPFGERPQHSRPDQRRPQSKPRVVVAQAVVALADWVGEASASASSRFSLSA